MVEGSNFVVAGLHHYMQDHTPNFIAGRNEKIASMVALHCCISLIAANRSTLEGEYK